jgi:hypothetical protein
LYKNHYYFIKESMTGMEAGYIETNGCTLHSKIKVQKYRRMDGWIDGGIGGFAPDHGSKPH